MENIVSRLKTRFDREAHRANNERIVHEYKIKKRLKEEMLQNQALDNLWQAPTDQGKVDFNNQQSSGLIQEVSQEYDSIADSRIL